jgi:hypothetical protein
MAPQHYKWDKLTWRKMAVYLDLWPMWPVADTVTNCRCVCVKGGAGMLTHMA